MKYTHMLRHLVITADDFGYCTERNDGIVACFTAGAVCRASLLVGGAAAEHAAHQAALHNIPLGLHVNLTEGVPVGEVGVGCSLLATDGRSLLGKHGFREAVSAGRVRMEQVELEVTAQLMRFTELTGSAPLWADGHQHVHVLPGVSEAVARALRRARVGEVRLPREVGVDSCPWVARPQQQFYSSVARDAAHAHDVFTRHGMRFTDGFVGMVTMGADMTSARLQERLLATYNELEQQEPPTSHRGATSAGAGLGGPLIPSAEVGLGGDPTPGRVVSVELMTHPGGRCVGEGGCGEGPDEFSRSPDREREARVLGEAGLHEFYRTHGVRLTPGV